MEEKGNSPAKGEGDISVSTQVEQAHNGSFELGVPEEENYKMTKTTYMAVIAFSWSWACVTCLNTSTTTISHQVARVGGVGELAWISNASLIVQVALQPIMASNLFPSSPVVPMLDLVYYGQ
jgi:hypothetical protein